MLPWGAYAGNLVSGTCLSLGLQGRLFTRWYLTWSNAAKLSRGGGRHCVPGHSTGAWLWKSWHSAGAGCWKLPELLQLDLGMCHRSLPSEHIGTRTQNPFPLRCLSSVFVCKVWRPTVDSGKYLKGPDPFSQSRQKERIWTWETVINGRHWKGEEFMTGNLLGLDKSDCPKLVSNAKYEVKAAHLCPTPCNPMDYTAHGILQARILEWVAFPFSKGSSEPRDRSQVSHIACGFFPNGAITEALIQSIGLIIQTLLSMCQCLLMIVSWNCSSSLCEY